MTGFYLHGETEPLGIEPVLAPGELKEWKNYRPWRDVAAEIRKKHEDKKPKNDRKVSIVGFGVDHGLNAHAGNGSHWRTTVVAAVRLDYLKGDQLVYVRLEGKEATELLAELAEAVAIRERGW